jgi:metallo-beta-lactamase class B
LAYRYFPELRMTKSQTVLVAAATLLIPSVVPAQSADTIGYSAADCPSCATWNVPVGPVRLLGNTFYVGTRGLSAILVTSPAGHILIDGGLPDSAPLIVQNIRALGFRETDIKLIVNSHVHYDHAGGIAALQRMSGAEVAASPKSAPVLRTGKGSPDDPQFGLLLPMAPVSNVRIFGDRDTLRVGPLQIVAHITAGHTPGGTSWSWRSCNESQCAEFVYADSQTPVSAEAFLFSRSSTYPDAVRDFERGLARIESLQCDVLITPHPSASDLWNRVTGADGARLIDTGACKRYAQNARRALAQRLAREANQ